MKLRIRHVTRYQFGDPVRYGLQQLRKTPKSSHGQTVLNWTTQVEGGRKELAYEDHHHNTVELLSIDRNAGLLVVSSEGEVEITQTDGIVGRHPGPAPLWLYRRGTAFTKAGAGARALLHETDPRAPDLERLHGLMALIRKNVAYETGASDPSWDAEEVIAHGRGVCQDHAHVALACTREMGFAARYVSGYLMLNDAVEQEAMHAWIEVHVDRLGWVGFDVSNGISPDHRYVRVATGLDYGDAAPVTGSRVGGNGEALSVHIEVAQQ
ncbi:transglutaminase family protein [Microbulbifer sp. S227A]|uniref:transglutaminase family protein n=1 Tax=Microbulbifer sp. S227A TaxID=3415131 RepID=UPI003C7B53E7